MVSVKQLEGDHLFLKQNTSSEQSKCSRVPLRGISTPLYRFGAPSSEGNVCGRFPCAAEEGQSLLDSLLLSQWEDRAWRGLLRYDVTTCETKVISGGRRFIAQLNEKCNVNSFTESDNKVLQPSGTVKLSFMKIQRDHILFCIASGEKESSELIPSTRLPKDGTLVVINENPVEYGHIFLVLYDIHHQLQVLDKRSLEMITEIAVETNNCSFRIFYDNAASSNSDKIYFQACYFANPLPVELLPVVPINGKLLERGMHIYEVTDYPVKALVFMSKNLKVLVEVVMEICSYLQDQNTVFNLLISDCGTKIFLFPQVHNSVTGRPLSAWECGGYFIFNAAHDNDRTSEVEISKRLASVSLDDKGFEALKQLCCGIADKFIP